MNSLFTKKATLNFVQNLVNSRDCAEVVLQGTYLKSAKGEIYIVFGSESLISVFHEGRLIDSYHTLEHKNKEDAIYQANFIFENIIETFYEKTK